MHPEPERHDRESFLGELPGRADPSVCSSPENAGMNAALNAPSPNRRRNRLGSFNATKNASAIGPVPIKRRDQHVPREAQDAADQRPSADRQNASQHTTASAGSSVPSLIPLGRDSSCAIA